MRCARFISIISFHFLHLAKKINNKKKDWSNRYKHQAISICRLYAKQSVFVVIKCQILIMVNLTGTKLLQKPINEYLNGKKHTHTTFDVEFSLFNLYLCALCCFFAPCCVVLCWFASVVVFRLADTNLRIECNHTWLAHKITFICAAYVSIHLSFSPNRLNRTVCAILLVARVARAKWIYPYILNKREKKKISKNQKDYLPDTNFITSWPPSHSSLSLMFLLLFCFAYSIDLCAFVIVFVAVYIIWPLIVHNPTHN